MNEREKVTGIEDRVIKAIVAEFPDPEVHRMIIIIDDPEAFGWVTFGEGRKVFRKEDEDIDVMRVCFRINMEIFNNLSKRWKRKAERVLRRQWQEMGGADNDYDGLVN